MVMADQSAKRAASAPSRVRTLPETADSDDGQEYKHIKLDDTDCAEVRNVYEGYASSAPVSSTVSGGSISQQEGGVSADAVSRTAQNENSTDTSPGQAARGRALKRKADDNGADIPPDTVSAMPSSSLESGGPANRSGQSSSGPGADPTSTPVPNEEMERGKRGNSSGKQRHVSQRPSSPAGSGPPAHHAGAVSASPPAVAGSKRSSSKAALEAPSPPRGTEEGFPAVHHASSLPTPGVERVNKKLIHGRGSPLPGGGGAGDGSAGSASPGATAGHQPKRGRVYASVLAEGLAGISLTENLGIRGEQPAMPSPLTASGILTQGQRQGLGMDSQVRQPGEGRTDEYEAQEGDADEAEDEEDVEDVDGGLRRPALPLHAQGPTRRRRLLQQDEEQQYGYYPTTGFPVQGNAYPVPASYPPPPSTGHLYSHGHAHAAGVPPSRDIAALSTVEPGTIPFVYRFRTGRSSPGAASAAGLDSATAEATVQALTSHHISQALHTASAMLEKLGIAVTFGHAPRPVPLHLVYSSSSAPSSPAAALSGALWSKGPPMPLGQGGGTGHSSSRTRGGEVAPPSNTASRKRGASMAVEDSSTAGPGAMSRPEHGHGLGPEHAAAGAGQGSGGGGAKRSAGRSHARTVQDEAVPVPSSTQGSEVASGPDLVPLPFALATHSSIARPTGMIAGPKAMNHVHPLGHSPQAHPHVHAAVQLQRDRTDAHSVATGSSYGGGAGGLGDSRSIAEGAGCVLLLTGFIPASVSCDDLYALCSPHGRVLRVKRLFRKPDTALVEFEHAAQATAALEALQNAPLKGRKLRVDRSKMAEVNVQEVVASGQGSSGGGAGHAGQGGMVPTGPDGKAWAVDYTHLK